eukprot:TRINITY_DN0_c833_g1_i1.p1 TRINITY_DN0_c833_g1~~TRINITY_DN0_c833_g1_i1.p1  ORF type:complete len:176 (+),score=35.98 TRINITY_DN0_c833_g1_i1:28-528(+)
MHILLQLLYFILAIVSVVLDYFMIAAFRHEHYRAWLRHLAEYTEIGELVVYFVFMVIGIFVEFGLLQTKDAQLGWVTTVNIFSGIVALLSLARIFAMTMLAINVHPGKTDFLGLFLVLVLLYLIMKYGIGLGYAEGLKYRIRHEKPKQPQPHREPVPVSWYPNPAY